ncbi:hypothetical protein MMC17_006149 [Xylographa soralifera]|nr:hypothetical protein [Xylographa soralifera]
MPGSSSRVTERETKLPGTPARKRHVQAANAWAQEQALEAEDNFDMENVWPLANPRDASTGGPSGDNGNNSLALSYRQNNENGATSHSEKVSQAILVRENNSWAQEALNVNDAGRLLKESDDDQYTISARARVDAAPNDNEETGLAIPKIKRAVVTFLSSNKETKNCSITEPTLSKPFSITRKMSLKGLRSVLTGTKVVLDDSMVAKVAADSPSVPSLRLDKASRVLGLNIQPEWQSGDFLKPPASAQDLEFSSSYRGQTFNQEVPNAFGLNANDAPTLIQNTKLQLLKKSCSSSRRPSKGEVELDSILLSHGHLSPTKSGSYGTVGRLEVVGTNFARIASQQGIIETMDNEGEDKAHRNQSPAGHPSSAVYSPSMYEGAWENHPNVGHSLPPCSPKVSHHAQDYHQLINEKLESDDSESCSLGDVSGMGAMYAPRSSLLTLASIISIASSLDENPTRRDSAEVLPLFADDAETNPVTTAQDSAIPETNAVPPPPSSFQNYQASAPVGFAQAMMELHHHIETSNDRLHRLVEDQNNRTHDELIRRCESLEEKIQKNGKGASKHHLNGLKNEFDILGHNLHVTATTGTETKRIIHTVLAKVAALDELLKNNSCKCGQAPPQRLSDQEGAFSRQAPSMSVNSHGAPTIISSPGYLHVPVQYNGNQFAHFGNSGSYGSFGTPQFHNEPSTNFEPRPRDMTEEYYRASGRPQMMRAEVPEIEIHEDLTTSRKDQHCTIPFGIKEPNGVLYELPSFMKMTSNGPMIFDESPVSASTEGIGGVADADDNKSSNQRGPSSTIPIGIDGPDGITYDLPSFMSYDADGNIVLDQFDEDGRPITIGHVPLGIEESNGVTHKMRSFLSPNQHDEAVVENKNIATGVDKVVAAAVGAAPTGVTMPNDIVYELPSFLGRNEDGQAEMTQDEESSGAENGDAVPQADHMPIGIRMDNGVVYELPTFMHINKEGQAEVNVEDEGVKDNGNEVAPSVGTGPVCIRGANGTMYELPLSLRINSNGLEEVVQQEESGDGQNSPYTPPTDGVPIGIRMDNGVLYELPTFMRINEEGLAEVDLQDEALIDHGNEIGLPIGNVPIGIRGPNGVIYEVPSFLRISDDGLEEVVQQEDPDAEQNSAHMPRTDGVPIGIRMNNGIIYEVPTFMNISEDGLVEIDQYNEPGTEITTSNAFTASDYFAWTEGPQGVWFNERATTEDMFDLLLN